MTTLYLTHGFIGSGKTTFSKKFCEDKKIIRLCSDELMTMLYGNNPPKELFQTYFNNVQNLIKNLAKEIIKKDKDVLIDAGLWKRKTRDDWRKFAKKLNADVVILFIDCPEATALKRTLKRTKEMPEGQFYINEEGFYTLKEKFEPLEKDEEHILIDGTKIWKSEN